MATAVKQIKQSKQKQVDFDSEADQTVLEERGMAHGDSSQQIRQRAVKRYIEPARLGGMTRFLLPIRPLMAEMEAEGFPKNRPAQFCAAVQKESFLAEQGIQVERREGPPSGKSTTVILHCRFDKEPLPTKDADETPSERAFRVTEKLRGTLKDVIQSYGGTKGYIHWVRGYEDEA